jgi:hypothetical protein
MIISNGTQIILINLSSIEYNGVMAKIINYDSNTNRYVVEMKYKNKSKKQISVKDNNILIIKKFLDDKEQIKEDKNDNNENELISNFKSYINSQLIFMNSNDSKLIYYDLPIHFVKKYGNDKCCNEISWYLEQKLHKSCSSNVWENAMDGTRYNVYRNIEKNKWFTIDNYIRYSNNGDMCGNSEGVKGICMILVK